MNNQRIVTKITKILAAPAVLLAVSCSPGRNEVVRTMKSATAYMMDSVSCNGGFVWRYLPDFSRRWGEMEATPGMIWMQDPATPQMGELMLEAYRLTEDEYFYDCAIKIAGALLDAQKECGGWNYVFDYDGEEALKQWYATTGRSAWRLEEFQHYYGNATFDDSATYGPACFLLKLYLLKKDAKVKAALDKAIDFVLVSQYPNGGWPQRFPIMDDHQFRGLPDYTPFITLNDDVHENNIDFLMQCRDLLGRTDLDDPIRRGMYLYVKLQQPIPLAGWADQYTPDDLKPANGRSYEPAAVNTATTANVCRRLIRYYNITGDKAFLQGIPAALDFLDSQRLPASEAAKWDRPSRDSGGFLVPRFLEPSSGKPLYVHRTGTNYYNGHYYTDQDITHTIIHYNSVARINTKRLRSEFENMRNYERPDREPEDVSAKQVRKVMESLDSRGRWLVPLGNMSNPYKDPSSVAGESSDTSYAMTFCGDEFDTSPYRTEDAPSGISVRDYIIRMKVLLNYIDRLNHNHEKNQYHRNPVSRHGMRHKK